MEAGDDIGALRAHAAFLAMEHISFIQAWALRSGAGARARRLLGASESCRCAWLGLRMFSAIVAWRTAWRASPRQRLINGGGLLHNARRTSSGSCSFGAMTCTMVYAGHSAQRCCNPRSRVHAISRSQSSSYRGGRADVPRRRDVDLRRVRRRMRLVLTVQPSARFGHSATVCPTAMVGASAPAWCTSTRHSCCCSHLL